MQPLGLLLSVLIAVPPSSEHGASRPPAVPARAEASAAGGSRSPKTAAGLADQHENAAVEHLARIYRIRVYDTFRQQRAEHDRRRAAWDRVLAAWKAAGSPSHQRHQLIAWLETATRNATPGSLGALPEIPRFGARDEPTPPVVRQEPEAQEPVVKRTAVLPSAPEEPVPLVPPAIAPPPRQPGGPAALREPRAASLETPPLASGPPALPRRQAPLRSGAPQNDVNRPSALLGRSPTPPHRSAETLPRAVDAPATMPSEPRLSQPATGPREDPAAALARQPAPLAAPMSTLPATAASQPTIPADDPPGQLPTEPRAQRGASRSTTLPQIAEQQQSLPLARRPTPLRPPPEAVTAGADTPVTTTAPPQPPRPPTEPEPAPRARVNRAELAARITGNGFALRALEAELNEDRPWNAKRLTPLVFKLSRLVMQRNDCLLFRELILEDERALVGEVEPAQPAAKKLNRCILQARARANAPDFPGTQAERSLELQLLDELSRTVAELASAGR